MTVWSGPGLHQRDVQRTLASVGAQSFAGSVDLELWEIDASPNPDDFLGRYTVRASEAGDGPKTASFSQSGALYRVVYRVA